ncbi:ABC transporter ATP-binding protein [Tardiphaga sp. vice352]|uniref:ABC transporter ATP-binding protein n=1 Tax=unclassified Tardiphaga TaxID=2631404 RepID=UPI0011623B99|nr:MULTISPECIES: ABC transporter ATP-binding protein [unclassified Tardiphaga]QDM15920.1 ABC transporter ATP-binding protein [Tardiphaga sp. vice278]QDM26117.1 ABC transporter ATP-binding protein [Tardiphaga sp. vice304]QDM31265.1 ABC transporter ATP-binding protein [Tardiphaga sp. vice352]
MSVLEVRGLRLGYHRSDAVHGIDLDVSEGAVVSLIGANGAGKTTTLRGLSGLLKPRSGSVRFDGQEMVGQAAYKTTRAGIVQVPEGRQIFANMTVEENLRMGAYLVADAAEIARRRAGVLGRFPRLGERLAQLAGLLSGGEQQMLAIGRALMSEPRLLLMDEPSMGLAPLFIEEIFAIIQKLKTEGRTILLVEQNAQAALEVSDYAYVLESGRIKLHGPAGDVANNPEVISAYLGSG